MVIKDDWTGERIHEMHIGGGGSMTWAQIVDITGLSIGTIRARAKKHRREVGIKTVQGQYYQRGKKERREPDTATWEENGNTARVECSNVRTLPEALAKLEVDEAVWEVERWGFMHREHEWEAHAKVEQKDLEYKEGVVNGTVKSEGIETVPLHSDKWGIWAALVRVNPIEVFPSIKPVVAAHKFKLPKPPKRGDIVTELIFSDSQVGFHRSTRTASLEPFHCRKTLDCIYQIAVYLEADTVRELGDGLDLPEWQDKFLKDPQFYWSTQPSLEEKHWQLARFRHALPGARIVEHQGNHEKRMPSALMTHLPAAYGLRRAGRGIAPQFGVLSVPYLLDLDGLGIEYIEGYPSDVEQLNDAAIVRHGDKTNKDLAKSATCVEIVGHSHRLKMTSYTLWGANGPREVYVYEIGCACRGGGITPGSKWGDQWQRGCACVRYEVGGDLVDVQLIPIQNGRALYDGRLFEGRDYVDDLQRDLPEWNW